MEPSPSTAAMAAAYEDYRRGALDRAERGYQEAVRLDPGSAAARNALGVVVAAQGRVAEAHGHFRAAFERDREAIGAATNLADAALNLGRLTEAHETLEAVAPLAPENADLQALLAEVLAALGRPREAFAAAARWAALAPAEAEAHRALGMLGARVGENDRALAAFRAARGLDGSAAGRQLDLQGIAAALEPARFVGPDPQVHAELTECLCADDVESQPLARAAGSLLAASYPLDPGAGLAAWQASGWPTDELLLALLERTINVDPRVERALTAQRHALLDAFVDGGALPAPWRRVAAAMAIQCLSNELAWRVSDGEAGRVPALAARLDARAGRADAGLADLVVAVALYRPLASLACAPALAARKSN